MSTVLRPAQIVSRGKEVELALRRVLFAKEASTAGPKLTSASRATLANSVEKDRPRVQHPALWELMLASARQLAIAAYQELMLESGRRLARFVLPDRLAALGLKLVPNAR